jgi:formylglycine-generating enzyme required for sulfatase activity
MGSPDSEALRSFDETQHLVTISKGFWMAKYEVTQLEYQNLIGTNPSYFNTNNGYTQDLSRPVEMVSWNDATNYCALLTQQEWAARLIPTNYVYRLPTESEWEYACRAGTTTAFYLGNALHSGQANFAGTYEYDAAIGSIPNPNGIFLHTTTPVGSYPANGWGLYDMIGNVWNYCQDWYDTYPSGSVTDPQGPESGYWHIQRGGSWIMVGYVCRSAQRVRTDATSTWTHVGFRVVLAPGQ